MSRGIVYALAAAALFGVGTPLAKLLAGSVAPLLLAGLLFHENYERRGALGMVAMVAGGLVLAWTPGQSAEMSTGALLVAVACIHEPLVHAHAHYPDLHHRHPHWPRLVLP